MAIYNMEIEINRKRFIEHYFLRCAFFFSFYYYFCVFFSFLFFVFFFLSETVYRLRPGCVHYDRKTNHNGKRQTGSNKIMYPTGTLHSGSPTIASERKNSLRFGRRHFTYKFHRVFSEINSFITGNYKCVTLCVKLP